MEAWEFLKNLARLIREAGMTTVESSFTMKVSTDSYWVSNREARRRPPHGAADTASRAGEQIHTGRNGDEFVFRGHVSEAFAARGSLADERNAMKGLGADEVKGFET